MPKWLFHPLVVLGVTVLAIWLYISLLRTEEKMQMSSESVSILDQEVQQIASEVEQLEERLAKANSQQSQEQRIRDELLMQKPGEYVIQLPYAQESSSETTQETIKTPLEAWVEILTGS